MAEAQLLAGRWQPEQDRRTVAERGRFRTVIFRCYGGGFQVTAYYGGTCEKSLPLATREEAEAACEEAARAYRADLERECREWGLLE